MDTLLPIQQDLTHNTTCGICDSIKHPVPGGLLMCVHCDIPCASPCGVCRAGMKGLSERGDKWPDGKKI